MVMGTDRQHQVFSQMEFTIDGVDYTTNFVSNFGRA